MYDLMPKGVVVLFFCSSGEYLRHTDCICGCKRLNAVALNLSLSLPASQRTVHNLGSLLL